MTNFKPARNASCSNRLLQYLSLMDIMRAGRVALLGCLVLLTLCLADPHSAEAQRPQTRTLPNVGYFNNFQDFYSGEYSRALRGFRSSARGGFTNINGPWIDSICYHAMVGECLFQTGDKAAALEQYNTAIATFAANGKWLAQTEFPDTIQAANNAVNQAKINWGTSGRNGAIGNFPDSFNVMIGNIDGINQNGVVQRAEFRPANIAEIMRCLTLAMRRRAEILGPVGGYDPATRQAINALDDCGIPRNSWGRAWVEIPLALGMVAEGDDDAAARKLQGSLQVMGRFDHPLTAVALLELGKIYFRSEKYAEAANLFHEATISAATYGHQAVLEEAFSWAATTHAAQGKGGVYPPLVNALAWAQKEGSKQLIASLALRLAEGYLQVGDTNSARQMLTQAAGAMQRNQISASSLGARLAFLQAHADFQSGNISGGLANLASSMNLQQGHSEWLRYIALADQFYVAGSIPDRAAADMFDQLLRDPDSSDWQVDPMESMSVLLVPHPQALEHWFEMAIVQRDTDKAIEISDRIRRQRFYSALPLGGRVMALRWVLEAHRGTLNNDALKQRQDFQLAHPTYRELSAQATTLLTELRDMPLVAEADAQERSKQKRLLSELQEVSNAQEAILADVAMRRVPAELVFPPVHMPEQIREKLAPRQLVLSYFSTSNSLYRFSLTASGYDVQRLEKTSTVRRDLANLLRDIGNFDKNQPVGEDVLSDESWKESAKSLADALLPSADASEWEKFDELVIVPDGILWYVPFELLQVERGSHEGDGEAEGVDAETVSLIERTNIRYLPTVSLALPDGRNAEPAGKLAVVTGKLYPKDDEQLANDVFAQVKEDYPEAVQLTRTLPGPSSLVSALIGRLLVLDDLSEPKGSVLNLAPMQLDQGKAGSDLNSWMALPFGGVDQVILPGFHTAAESGLRQRNADGSEVFLAVCSMMASGTRTALISRWRTGGQSSYELMREFLRELPRESAMQAWRRSLDLAWRGDIVPDLEPRLKESSRDAVFDPKHPFFWAGYMLIDTGMKPLPIVEAGEIDDEEEGEDKAKSDKIDPFGG